MTPCVSRPARRAVRPRAGRAGSDAALTRRVGPGRPRAAQPLRSERTVTRFTGAPGQPRRASRQNSFPSGSAMITQLAPGGGWPPTTVAPGSEPRHLLLLATPSGTASRWRRFLTLSARDADEVQGRPAFTRRGRADAVLLMAGRGVLLSQGPAGDLGPEPGDESRAGAVEGHVQDEGSHAGARGTARGSWQRDFLQADLRKAAHFPAGHAQALVNPLDVRGAEVHALPDASVDDVVGDRLPGGVGAGDAECVRAGQRYGGRRARAEEGVEDSLLRADLAAVAAGVFGVLRGRPERRPAAPTPCSPTTPPP